MEWLQQHLHLRCLPPAVRQDLRDADHRLANVTMALHADVLVAAGGSKNLARLVQQMKEDR